MWGPCFGSSEGTKPGSLAPGAPRKGCALAFRGVFHPDGARQMSSPVTVPQGVARRVEWRGPDEPGQMESKATSEANAIYLGKSDEDPDSLRTR